MRLLTILTAVPYDESTGPSVEMASGNPGHSIGTAVRRCDSPHGVYHHHELARCRARPRRPPVHLTFGAPLG
jgi:hypothetical protein